MHYKIISYAESSDRFETAGFWSSEAMVLSGRLYNVHAAVFEAAESISTAVSEAFQDGVIVDALSSVNDFSFE